MVSTGYYPIIPKRIGAVEPYVYGLSKNLALRNRVHVFGIGEGEENVENFHVKTFPYTQALPNTLKGVFGTRLGYQIPYNMFLLDAIVDLNKKDPIDVLHIHDANSGFAATLGKLALKIPYVCSIHNEICASFPIKSCNKVFAVSDYIRDFLIQKRNFSPQKVDILNVAIDLKAYESLKTPQQAKAELGLTGHDIILFLGRKCPEKGPQVLVDALPKIVSRNPRALAVLIGPDYDFMLSARNYSYSAFLMQKAQKLSVSENISYKGFLSAYELSLYFNAADVCVVPSVWQDPCPTVVKEALALKKPVVASNIGGIPYMIKNGYNGLLVPANNSLALADKVNYLLENPNYARELGENGRIIVEKDYTFDAVGAQCQKFYETL